MQKTPYKTVALPGEMHVKWPSVIEKRKSNTCICRHKLAMQTCDVLNTHEGREVMVYAVPGKVCERCQVFYPDRPHSNRITDGLYFLYQEVAGLLPSGSGSNGN